MWRRWTVGSPRPSVSTLAEKHAQLEDKIADTKDRSRRNNVRVHGVPENAETLNVLAFLSDAIRRWFSNLGSVEIRHAHCVGAPKEDANGRPVSCTIILKLLRFTVAVQLREGTASLGGVKFCFCFFYVSYMFVGVCVFAPSCSLEGGGFIATGISG